MRIPHRVLALFAALALVGAGCTQPPAATQTGTGVSGHVTLGPVCPVERMPPDPACAPRPYQVSLAIKRADGTDVTTVKADASGAYQAALSPGSYSVGPAPGGPMLPRGETKSFVVKAGEMTYVDLSYDSGIR